MHSTDQHTKPKSPAKQNDLNQDTILFNAENPIDQSVVDEPVTIKPGTTLNNRFDILELIGAGGMGTVYKALDKRDIETGNSCFIAIKVLNNECKKNTSFLKALYEETKNTRLLSHQNIVTVYDFDRESNLVYMTMEFIEGVPLNQIIKRNPLGVNLPEAIDMITQIGNALRYAHSKHIIHLDLKPNNIFFDRYKHIKILDFGLAQKLNTSLTDNGEPSAPMALTPSYASIELLNDKTPSASDDIYAFACVCYELLTGKHPYNRERSDIAFKKQLVPKKIKSLNNRQWRALKRALALQKKNRTESIEKFLLEFNTKKSNFKYIFLGGFVALLLSFSYYQFQAKLPAFVAPQKKIKEGSGPLVERPMPNIQTPASKSNYESIPDVNGEQVNELKVISSKSEAVPYQETTLTSKFPIKNVLGKEQGKINIWTDKKNYKIGTMLTLGFDVDRALYVQIFIVNSEGLVTTLFPNPYQKNNLVEPNKIYQIPPKNAKFTLDISGPKGVDRIVAIASLKPFPENTLAIEQLREAKNELSESYIQSQATYQVY